MQGNGKINIRQFKLLVIVYIIGSSILILPSGLAIEAKQDAWIASIVGVGVGSMFIPLYTALGNIFPTLTLVEFSEQILGKWVGKSVALLFVSFSFLLTALVLRNIGDFVVTNVIPETPIQFVHILFLSIVVMAAYLGPEVFSRTAEILFPWVIILFFFLVIALLPQFEFVRIEPIFDVGIKPIIRASIPMIGTPFLELVVFLMILPNVNQTKGVGKHFLGGALFGGIVLIIIVGLSILILGADLTSRQMYPSLTLAKKINIVDFLQRLEVLMAGVWFLTIFFKAAICFYVSVLGLAQVLKLSNYRPLILPFAMIILVLSIVAYPNTSYFIDFVSKIWTPYAATFGLLIPLLLLGVKKFRTKSE